MAVVVNESEIAPESHGTHVSRQRLITEARIPGTNILLDRLTFAAGASSPVSVSAGSIAWFHVLEGEITLALGGETHTLSRATATFLAPGASGALSADAPAAMLYVEVPDASRFDAALSGNAPPSRVIDWMREPLLDSKYDSRKRIYLATHTLFGTSAIKAEMIIYPPGTSGSKHRHEGAEHFKYVLKGKGTGYADDTTHSLRAGDMVYHPAGEWHFSKTEGGENVEFIEFFVPGTFETIWESERICTWLPTGKSITGDKPVREIAAHAGSTPADV